MMIEVLVARATGTATATFRVLEPLPPPVLTGVSRDTVLGGDTLTISGRHFGDIVADVRVSVGSGGAEVLAVDDTVLVARLPAPPRGTCRSPSSCASVLPSRATCA